MTVGERIRRARERRGWSIQTLADRATLPYQTVSRIETGRHTTLQLDTAAKLAKALGVTVDYIAGMYDDPDDQEHHAA